MLYDFFRDQGSIIAGLLALVAGWIAYRGAISAAEKQVAVVEQQNEHLRSESKQRLEREEVIAVRLLLGVLRRINEDITRLNKLLDQPAYSKPNSFAPADWSKLIYKPALSTVWSSLGTCGPNAIYNYLLLDAKIDEFTTRSSGLVDVHLMGNNLADLKNIVNELKILLEDIERRKV